MIHSGRRHMVVYGIFHLVMAVLLGWNKLTFGLFFYPGWFILFLIASILCFSVAWRYKNRNLRVVSGTFSQGLAVFRGLTQLFLGGNVVVFFVWMALAYSEYLLWPYLLPPHIDISDLIHEPEFKDALVEAVHTGEIDLEDIRKEVEKRLKGES